MNKTKTLKIVNIVLNVIFYAFIFCVLLFAISTISKKDQKHVASLFGNGYLVVQTDSMKWDYETHKVKKENFDEGELILVKVLKDSEKDDLKVGDIITYYDANINGLNTHRIVNVNVDSETGKVISYTTKGDNTPGYDIPNVNVSDVVAKYNGSHSKFFGGIVGFISNPENPIGFILCIVLPAVVFLVYTVAMFIKSLLAVNTSKVKNDKEAIIAEYEAKLAALQKEKEATESKEENSSEETEKIEEKESE